MMKTNFLILIISTLLFSSCSTKDGQYYYTLSEKQLSQNKFPKALNSAKKAESLFTKDDFQWQEVIVLQGEIYLWQNDEEKALNEFIRIFNQYPENDDLLLNIVVTCIRTNHSQLAKDFCENGILSHNYSSFTNGMFYYYLAELEFGINNERCRDLILRAKECFLKADSIIFDSKIDDLISRLEAKLNEPYISISG